MPNKVLFHLSDLREGMALSFPVNQSRGFAVRKEGKVYAYINKCPHLGIPLEWQENDFLDANSELIQCSSHGALFAIDTGECISGPCTGDTLTPLSIVVEDDLVLLAS